MITDHEQRRLATDPTRSFIVQAPAGSGKTELLSQRFLRLLACVQAPEQIIALTFTRKAASEMKERILRTLRQAEQGLTAASPHQQDSLQYAQEALANDRRHQWNLLKHPHRLRIMTIDALCQRLSVAIPSVDQELPFAEITDAPQLLYERAARACLHDAIHEPSLHPPLQTLLEHLDNRQDRLIKLWVELLSCREQWLEVIFLAKQLTPQDFETPLKALEEHTLGRLLASIPEDCHAELVALSQEMACIENNPLSPRDVLRNWHSLTASISREEAYGLACLFLTQDNQLRQGFDHHVGLKKDRCPDYAMIKQRSKILCASLRQNTDFATLLAQVKRLPEPVYSAEQWQVLQALLVLLPFLVAQLQIIFRQSNSLDFTQITQLALQALGDKDCPTDLDLYLDNRIHHLLIDEFQDTSIQQVELLEKLVTPWEAGDGKTLFLVGDPMQSIYRFRQAEVGLFLKVQQQGLGSVSLQALELSSNFRSTTNLIEWINAQFQRIFPQQEDIESGAISFHPSAAVLPASACSQIIAYQYANKGEEAKGLVHIVQAQLAFYPEDKVAILVRSRTQLTEIIQQLRQASIPFQGIDINPLSQLAHLRDLWTLTKALLFPACRLSWLALLRSPYCGLTLDDLHQIANINPKKSIYSALQSLRDDACPNLSKEGRLRAQYVFEVLRLALAVRHQSSMVDWIRNTAQQLHLSQLIEPNQEADLEQFWRLLERHLKLHQFPDLETLNRDFEKLYSKQSTPAQLQIMTIHKSKGLEFDTVIIPGLSNSSNSMNTPLIRWLKIPRQDNKNYLLLSPIKAAHEQESRLYNYLQDIELEKESYELQRLLYVACTRAKKRLFLLDNQTRDNQRSFRQLLKSQTFYEHADVKPNPEIPLEGPESTVAHWSRLPIEFFIEPPQRPTERMNMLSPCSPANQARQLGILTHELLQWICTYHPTEENELPWSLMEQRAKHFGFSPEQIRATQDLLDEQVQKMRADPIGRWICQAHQDEKNEYALLVQDNQHIKTRIIDRTFIENGIRWIIDFKTGQDDLNHQEKHRHQVNHYAELLSSQATMPIACGVYYLASQKWLTWKYTERARNTV